MGCWSSFAEMDDFEALIKGIDGMSADQVRRMVRTDRPLARSHASTHTLRNRHTDPASSLQMLTLPGDSERDEFVGVLEKVGKRNAVDASTDGVTRLLSLVDGVVMKRKVFFAWRSGWTFGQLAEDRQERMREQLTRLMFPMFPSVALWFRIWKDYLAELRKLKASAAKGHSEWDATRGKVKAVAHFAHAAKEAKIKAD